MEQLPGKIKGGNHVSKCVIMVFLLFCLLLFVCGFLQNTINIGISANLYFGVQNVGSISGPH